MSENKESPIPEESPETDAGSFSPIGIAMGVSIGTAIGVATDNLGIWLGIGVAIGVSHSVTSSFSNPKRMVEKAL